MNQLIRVLHVFGRLDAGGAESRTMDIYRQIDRSKVQFDFAIHTEEKCFFTDEVESLGGRIYSFPRLNSKNYFQYKKSWKDFFKEHTEYSIIHGHQTSTGFVYLNEAKKANVLVRIAHSRNSSKENFIKRNICKLAKLYATHLFAVSELAGVSEFGKKAVEKKKVKVLPNAINAKAYTHDETMRKQKRNELGIENNLAVCHIGRLHPQKNHVFLLRIFKKIKEKNENAKLILIGEGPLESDIKKQSIELGIHESVSMIGTRADVPDLLQAMDILVFPSLFEGLPGVVLEAQAAGLPCMISDKITKEVKITNLVEYISLERSAEYWAEKTLEHLDCYERKITFKIIAEAGYDIKGVAKWYEDFYISNGE